MRGQWETTMWRSLIGPPSLYGLATCQYMIGPPVLVWFPFHVSNLVVWMCLVMPRFTLPVVPHVTPFWHVDLVWTKLWSVITFSYDACLRVIMHHWKSLTELYAMNFFSKIFYMINFWAFIDPPSSLWTFWILLDHQPYHIYIWHS
jgi:hypothetical protein